MSEQDDPATSTRPSDSANSARIINKFPFHKLFLEQEAQMDFVIPMDAASADQHTTFDCVRYETETPSRGIICALFTIAKNDFKAPKYTENDRTNNVLKMFPNFLRPEGMDTKRVTARYKSLVKSKEYSAASKGDYTVGMSFMNQPFLQDLDTAVTKRSKSKADGQGASTSGTGGTGSETPTAGGEKKAEESSSENEERVQKQISSEKGQRQLRRVHQENVKLRKQVNQLYDQLNTAKKRTDRNRKRVRARDVKLEVLKADVEEMTRVMAQVTANIFTPFSTYCLI
jgi:hypothetical protein